MDITRLNYEISCIFVEFKTVKHLYFTINILFRLVMELTVLIKLTSVIG